MTGVPTYPICPRCEEPVLQDGHELEVSLVNAPERTPSTYLHGIFHHECAAAVWRAARRVWFGEDR